MVGNSGEHVREPGTGIDGVEFYSLKPWTAKALQALGGVLSELAEPRPAARALGDRPRARAGDAPAAADVQA